MIFFWMWESHEEITRSAEKKLMEFPNPRTAKNGAYKSTYSISCIFIFLGGGGENARANINKYVSPYPKQVYIYHGNLIQYSHTRINSMLKMWIDLISPKHLVTLKATPQIGQQQFPSCVCKNPSNKASPLNNISDFQLILRYLWS